MEESLRVARAQFDQRKLNVVLLLLVLIQMWCLLPRSGILSEFWVKAHSASQSRAACVTEGELRGWEG
jgi:hypothetical protein